MSANCEKPGRFGLRPGVSYETESILASDLSSNLHNLSLCESRAGISLILGSGHPPGVPYSVPDMTEPLEPSLQQAIYLILTIFKTRGVDLPKALAGWTDRYLEGLGELGADFEIRELLRAGCKKIPLAAALKGGVVLAQLPSAYYDALGDTKRLAQLAEQLETTALLFDGMARQVASAIPPDAALGTTPGPKKMAAYLREYQALARFVPLLMQTANIRKVHDVERHLPTAYVKNATGDWHDREVAALISAATGTELDEGAHRVWRNRNFSEINLPLGRLWEIIATLDNRT